MKQVQGQLKAEEANRAWQDGGEGRQAISSQKIIVSVHRK